MSQAGNLERCDTISSTTGTYTICEFLGKGGFGHVYLAIYSPNDSSGSKKVAIKAFYCNPTERGCLTEGNDSILLSNDLTNPNIIQSYEFFTALVKRGNICLMGEIPFISMEYCPSDLAKKIECMIKNQNEFTPQIIYDYICQIANGCEALHSKNVSHSDLKSANILISCQGEREVLKIADFGKVKKFGSDYCYHGTGFYELLKQCGGGQCTDATDICAIGITFYELCITPQKLSEHIHGIRYNVTSGQQIHLPERFPRKDNVWLNRMITCDRNKRMTATNVKDEAKNCLSYCNLS